MSGEIGVPFADPSIVAVIVWAASGATSTVVARSGAASARSSRRVIRQRCRARASVSIAQGGGFVMRARSTDCERVAAVAGRSPSIATIHTARGPMRTTALLFAALTTLSTAAGAQSARKDAAPTGPVARFDWYAYSGHDSVYDVHPAGKGEYLNPIFSGFYPDPALKRVGHAYYYISSTFAYFPGIPIFRSKDLVNWTQIGNVIHRPEQLKFDSLGMSRGVFAPTINYKDGTFYVLNTCVDCGGNYLVTATNPAGPWSNPTWIPEVGGIDPSIFFDDDGKTYVINNDEPPGGSTYPGHRAIWIRTFDVAAKRVSGPATMLVNG